MKHFIFLALTVLALSGCKNPDPEQNPAEEAAAATEQPGDDGFATEQAPPNTETSSAFTPVGRLAPQDTDTDTDAQNHLQTGTDTINNDDTESSTAISDHLYSTHDKYHGVTCWYMHGPNGEWALSCLPDSQVANVKE